LSETLFQLTLKREIPSGNSYAI